MKKNKKLKNILNSGVYIIVIISISIIMQLKPKENQVQLAIQTEVKKEINKETNIAKENIQSETNRNTQSEVTSRHSMVRSKKKGEASQAITQEQYAKLEDITISKEMDLTVRTGISKEDFKQLISRVKHDTSKFFYENSDMIYEVCEEYQINEIFFCGLISAESGWNIASNHRRTHNYISLMTKNGLIHYNSVEEGITAAAKALHNNYLTEGGRFYNGKTLYGVKTKFCPASSTWVELVYGRMQQIMKCI